STRFPFGRSRRLPARPAGGQARRGRSAWGLRFLRVEKRREGENEKQVLFGVGGAKLSSRKRHRAADGEGRFFVA
ncbi:hypothetical protein, partial [Umezakia ovalisporum]